MSDPGGTTSSEALQALTGFLDDQGIGYRVLSHDPTFTAGDEALAAGVEPASMVKTLVLRARDEFLIAAIPANRTLDLERARVAMRASPQLRLATEQEIADEFPQFEVGAIPPLGIRVPEVIDIRLLYRERVACAAGDHRHSVLVDPRDIVGLAEPRVADICRHDDHAGRFHDVPHV